MVINRWLVSGHGSKVKPSRASKVGTSCGGLVGRSPCGAIVTWGISRNVVGDVSWPNKICNPKKRRPQVGYDFLIIPILGLYEMICFPNHFGPWNKSFKRYGTFVIPITYSSHKSLKVGHGLSQHVGDNYGEGGQHKLGRLTDHLQSETSKGPLVWILRRKNQSEFVQGT